MRVKRTPSRSVNPRRCGAQQTLGVGASKQSLKVCTPRKPREHTVQSKICRAEFGTLDFSWQSKCTHFALRKSSSHQMNRGENMTNMQTTSASRSRNQWTWALGSNEFKSACFWRILETVWVAGASAARISSLLIILETLHQNSQSVLSICCKISTMPPIQRLNPRFEEFCAFFWL